MNKLKEKLEARSRERQRARDEVKKDTAAIRFLKKLIKVKEEQRREHVRVMFDSTTVDEIPSNAPAVAGYVDGIYNTFKDLLTRFPKAKHLSIAVFSKDSATCLDCETGDATPAEVPPWVHERKLEGKVRPMVYGSASEWRNRIWPELRAAGFKRDDIRVWTAHYTFEPHICGPKTCGELPFTADGTQWTDKALGRNLDQTKCGPFFFGG